jgi:hypothetical protein
MSRRQPGKLRVRLSAGLRPETPVVPRRFTLTHSDTSGDPFLTIGREYDEQQISGWHPRLMRDEMLAEWRAGEDGAALHVYCYVSGGLVFGSVGWRYAIFQRELPLVLEAFRHGDRQLFEVHPELDRAPIEIHFQSHRRRYRLKERWGTPADYQL